MSFNQGNKIEQYIKIIDMYRIVSFHPIENAKVCRRAKLLFKPPSIEIPDTEWEEFDSTKPFDFGTTKDDWFAFQGDLTLTQEKIKFPEFLPKITFSINKNYLVRAWDDDSPSGPEGRCWLDINPLTSLDSFHDGTFFSQNLMNDKITSHHFEAIIFTAHCSSHHKLTKFGITMFHRDTEILYRVLKVLMNLIEELESQKDSNLKTAKSDKFKIIDAVEKALCLLDIRDSSYPIKLNSIRVHDTSKQSFYLSVKNCLNSLFLNLERNFPTKIEKNFSVNVIGYSHLDSCWLWPFSLSKSKITNTMTNTINLLNFPSNFFSKSEANQELCFKQLSKESDWKFLVTAPQHLEWIKENDSDLYNRIIHEKNRIFIDGAMWVESDTTLSSGETLVRQFMMVNSEGNVLFLPDCFGFSASLPQLMKLAGVIGFVSSKITWSEYTKFPYSTFKWRGIDGTDIVTHFISNPNDAKPGTTKYVGTNTAHEIIRTFQDYKQKEILPNSPLCMMGRGDGGGGVDEEMIWNIRILSMLSDSFSIESLPKINFPDLTQLFQSIEKKENELNIWDDELYLERHQGTLTSQEEVKRICKQYESHLHSIEWLIVVLESITNDFKFNIHDFTELSLDDFWKQSLLFHFHDAVTGTSTNQANFELLTIGLSSISVLEKIESILLNFLNDIVQKKSTLTDHVIYFNSLSHDREIGNKLVVPSGGWKIIDSKQNPVLFEKVETDFYERINLDDSFKIHHFTVNEMNLNGNSESNSETLFDSTNFTVTTESLVIKFNSKTGGILSVKDRKKNREFLNDEGNKFLFYEDRSVAYPAWDIQLYHKEMQLDRPKIISFTFGEKNSVVAEYLIDELSQSKIIQKIEFKNSQMTFSTRVNWKDHDKLLKVSFPTKIRSRSARFGIQFGHIERPTHQNTIRDMAKYEVFGRWADLSDSTGGVTICADIKSGYDVHEGEMMLSLLKAPLQTDKWCDYGWRKFTYKVDFHAEMFDAVRATNMSDELNYPLIYCQEKVPTNMKYKLKDYLATSDLSLLEGKFVEIKDEFNNNDHQCVKCGVILETLKPSNDGNGFVARFYETKGGMRKVNISFPLLQEKKWKVNFVDFHENILSYNQIIILNNSKCLEFSIYFKPFQIISIKITSS
ncbi:Alpha-mannosidase 2C1 [Tritrichomonas musculus]|uniref:alpha-mannosidase n=1 Tax=Tritrichomonas musculus TaxID=1915356 RepID=A0ABR2KHR0_9EUKA